MEDLPNIDIHSEYFMIRIGKYNVDNLLSTKNIKVSRILLNGFNIERFTERDDAVLLHTRKKGEIKKIILRYSDSQLLIHDVEFVSHKTQLIECRNAQDRLFIYKNISNIEKWINDMKTESIENRKEYWDNFTDRLKTFKR